MCPCLQPRPTQPLISGLPPRLSSRPRGFCRVRSVTFWLSFPLSRSPLWSTRRPCRNSVSSNSRPIRGNFYLPLPFSGSFAPLASSSFLPSLTSGFPVPLQSQKAPHKLLLNAEQCRFLPLLFVSPAVPPFSPLPHLPPPATVRSSVPFLVPDRDSASLFECREFQALTSALRFASLSAHFAAFLSLSLATFWSSVPFSCPKQRLGISPRMNRIPSTDLRPSFCQPFRPSGRLSNLLPRFRGYLLVPQLPQTATRHIIRIEEGIEVPPSCLSIRSLSSFRPVHAGVYLIQSYPKSEALVSEGFVYT